jgi:heat shock protein HslJ
MRMLPLLSAFALVGSLAACGVVGSDAARTMPAPGAPPARLAGTAWVAEDIDGKGVVDRAQSTIEFIDDKRVAGSLGCNRYTGSYGADATGMRFTQIASTRRLCPEALMQQEARFGAARIPHRPRWRDDAARRRWPGPGQADAARPSGLTGRRASTS